MVSEFQEKIIRKRHDLLQLIYDFNYNTVANVHPSHFPEEVSKPVLKMIAQNPKTAQKLNQHYRAHFEIKEPCFDDFSRARMRLALLDGKTLQKLMLYAGAALCSSRVIKVVSKNDLNVLKESMGRELYQFTVKKVPFFLRNIPQLSSAKQVGDNLFEDILALGQHAFEICFSNAPESLIKRLKLKLASSVTFDFSNKYDDAVQEEIWTFLRRILLREIGKHWAPCFK